MTPPVDFLIFSASDTVINHKTLSDTLWTQKPWRLIGPSKIANSLRSAGYTVQIVNFAEFMSYDELIEIGRKFIGQGTVIGISTTFLLHPRFKTHTVLAEAVKEFKSKYGCKIILGGPSPGKVQTEFDADILVEGYAENKIVDVFNKLKNNGISKKLLAPWDITTCRHRWHESDFIQQGETLPLEIGRGCIFKCNFCKFEMTGKRRGEYVRDMSLIRDEMIENYEKYNITNYMLMDDTFNDDVYKIDQWYDMVESLPFKIQYACYLRADLLHRFKDSAKKIYQSGMRSCSIGLETMNKQAGLAIGKVWGSKHGKEFLPELLHDICENKSLIGLNYIIGLPGDTIDDVWNWIYWAKETGIQGVFAQPLIIDRPSEIKDLRIYSDIDINYEKYGYRFPYNNNPYAWDNDIMKYSDVIKEHHSMVSYISNNFCEGSWRSMGSLSVGYSLEEVIKRTLSDLYADPEYKSRTLRWIEGYKKDLRK